MELWVPAHLFFALGATGAMISMHFKLILDLLLCVIKERKNALNC